MKKLLLSTLLAVAVAAQVAFAEIRVGGRSKRAVGPSPLGALRVDRYNPYSLANPYGAGSRYKTDGLMNPFSPYGSPYSNKSWRNPYATKAPKLYGPNGTYYGRLSRNRYHPDSTSNRYGKYGSPYSPQSINNRYGAGSRYRTSPIYVWPSK